MFFFFTPIRPFLTLQKGVRKLWNVFFLLNIIISVVQRVREFYSIFLLESLANKKQHEPQFSKPIQISCNQIVSSEELIHGKAARSDRNAGKKNNDSEPRPTVLPNIHRPVRNIIWKFIFIRLVSTRSHLLRSSANYKRSEGNWK